MNKIEMHIIPDPHGFYARTETKIIPAKPISSASQARLLTDEEIELASQGSLPQKSNERPAIYDVRLERAFFLPPEVSFQESQTVQVIRRGHHIMPFSYSGSLCFAESYGTALESAN